MTANAVNIPIVQKLMGVVSKGHGKTIIQSIKGNALVVQIMDDIEKNSAQLNVRSTEKEAAESTTADEVTDGDAKDAETHDEQTLTEDEVAEIKSEIGKLCALGSDSLNRIPGSKLIGLKGLMENINQAAQKDPLATLEKLLECIDTAEIILTAVDFANGGWGKKGFCATKLMPTISTTKSNLKKIRHNKEMKISEEYSKHLVELISNIYDKQLNLAAGRLNANNRGKLVDALINAKNKYADPKISTEGESGEKTDADAEKDTNLPPAIHGIIANSVISTLIEVLLNAQNLPEETKEPSKKTSGRS
jgi:hypothetical protein